jgi:tetratricopeptide (TPR) repeat protein
MGLAQALYEKGEWERAVAEFDRAIFLDEANAKPGLVEALLAFGDYLERQRDRDKALAIYKRVLKYTPHNNSAENRIKRLEPANLLQRVIRRFGFS